MKPLISIVTICYNCENEILETLASVCSQKYEGQIQYVIKDGASVDRTNKHIREFISSQHNPRIEIIYQSTPDNGIYDAMNQAVKQASGAWINFMNAGDTFASDDVLAKIFSESPETDILYGDTCMIASWGKFIRKPLPLHNIASGMVFCHQSTFIRMSFMKAHLYSEDYRIASDYHLFYTAYEQKAAFYYMPVLIANYSLDNGISARHFLLARKEEALINGRVNTLSWQLLYLFYRCKEALKMIIQHRLLHKYRTFKYKRTIQ